MRNRLILTVTVFASLVLPACNAENPVNDLSKKQIKQIYDNNVRIWRDLK